MSQTRDAIRSHIFKTREVKKVLLEFFGATIELRQATLADILEAQTNDNRQAGIIDLLVKRAYVPGTDDRVFEDADGEQLKALPFGADFQRLTKAMETLTEVNFLDTKPDSKVTDSSSE